MQYIFLFYGEENSSCRCFQLGDRVGIRTLQSVPWYGHRLFQLSYRSRAELRPNKASRPGSSAKIGSASDETEPAHSKAGARAERGKTWALYTPLQSRKGRGASTLRGFGRSLSYLETFVTSVSLSVKISGLTTECRAPRFLQGGGQGRLLPGTPGVRPGLLDSCQGLYSGPLPASDPLPGHCSHPCPPEQPVGRLFPNGPGQVRTALPVGLKECLLEGRGEIQPIVGEVLLSLCFFPHPVCPTIVGR